MNDIKPGIYRHYKGNLYEVIGLAVHSETLEKLVLYKPLYPSKEYPEAFWVRPLGMFSETLYFNGEEVPRFRKT